ncbi:MAG: hypothetical protein HUU46_20920 [Candidatus Hydrogenedentes bacterium]|nr:hypothetical protein [Candidatus Hydrogenedentota bacterium]
MLHLLRSAPTPEQVTEMLEFYSYIKLAVDIRREVLAGGGEMHADCEAVLLENGSRQIDIWGADWRPKRNLVTFESLINIRPWDGNNGMEIADAALRRKIETIVRRIFDAESPQNS